MKAHLECMNPINNRYLLSASRIDLYMDGFIRFPKLWSTAGERIMEQIPKALTLILAKLTAQVQ